MVREAVDGGITFLDASDGRFELKTIRKYDGHDWGIFLHCD
jgi:hypothetical protein